MEAIQALADLRNNRIVGSAYLDECRMILVGVNTTRIAHYPRNLNKVAHLVARYNEDLDTNVWLDGLPLFLVPQLVEDVTLFLKLIKFALFAKKIDPLPRQENSTSSRDMEKGNSCLARMRTARSSTSVIC
jgi:hypothetical protein